MSSKVLKLFKRSLSKSLQPPSSYITLNEAKRKQIHFIGIGGIGMSSLARWFLAQNWLVTGSDASKSGITQELSKDGIKVKIGHKKTNLPIKTDLVVMTSAIPAENLELQAAEELGVKTIKYAEALGDLTRQYKTIAIAGSHGKSSTTAMVASILIKAGMDPTVIIGTKMNGWNFRAGKSEWLVIEADEYKGAFWNYRPHSAIVTNIDLEHVDFYKNLSDVKNSFFKFLNSVSSEGYIVMNGENQNLMSIISRLKQENIIIFSEKDKKIIKRIKKIIKVPGKHNIMNALAAWQLAKALGIKENIIEKALAEYKGVWRRIEYKGKTSKGIKVFDDYAHHPTEVKATLQALREKFPRNKIAVCFEPHQQRRLTVLYEEFITSWSNADYVLLVDVYNPRGRDEVSKTKNSESLAKDINKVHALRSFGKTDSPTLCPFITTPENKRKEEKAIYIASQKNIRQSVTKLPLKRNDILVIMGAGSISDITPLLLKS